MGVEEEKLGASAAAARGLGATPECPPLAGTCQYDASRGKAHAAPSIASCIDHTALELEERPTIVAGHKRRWQWREWLRRQPARRTPMVVTGIAALTCCAGG